MRRVQVVDTKVNSTTIRIQADHIQHLPFGPVQSLDYGNGLHLSRSYDLDYRLTGQTTGNLQNQINNLNTAQNQTYTYDPLNRLMVVSGSPSLSYDYDIVGNRIHAIRDQTQIDYRYKPSNQQLLSLTGTQNADIGHTKQYGSQTLTYAGSPWSSKAMLQAVNRLLAVDDVSGGGLSMANNSGKLYHYTPSKYTGSIVENGQRPGASGKVFTTPDGTKSGLQSQIDLALPPNRGVPDALLEIDTRMLNQMVVKTPDAILVHQDFNMPGGGQEVIFDTLIPSEVIRRVS